MSTEIRLIAPCGLDCANECDIYKAPHDPGIARRLTEWMRAHGHPEAQPDWFHCTGCRGPSGQHWSPDCRIRNCCIERRQLDSCADCGIFPCKPLCAHAREGERYSCGLERLRAMKGPT